jgi:anion-transporting  ArsA/GET3 family ATPase
LHSLLDKRLIFVTGKGGVGKSTVSIALGLMAARSGLRCIVAELASQVRVQRTFDPAPPSTPMIAEHFREVELEPGLYTISIDPQHAMEEYLQVKAGPVGHALSGSRVFQAFAMATPGMRELLSIGKIWELAQLQRRTRGAAPYDLVVVDAPATGHGVGILRTPKTFADIARVGPIAHQGRAIAATIADRSFTGVVAVSTPEEMPVNETLALRAALERDQFEVDAVILNAVYPQRFSAAQVSALSRAAGRAPTPIARAALRAALSEHTRAETQRAQVVRLREGLGIEPIELPFLPAGELGLDELRVLSSALEAGLRNGRL